MVNPIGELKQFGKGVASGSKMLYYVLKLRSYGRAEDIAMGGFDLPRGYPNRREVTPENFSECFGRDIGRFLSLWFPLWIGGTAVYFSSLYLYHLLKP